MVKLLIWFFRRWFRKDLDSIAFGDVLQHYARPKLQVDPIRTCSAAQQYMDDGMTRVILEMAAVKIYHLSRRHGTWFHVSEFDDGSSIHASICPVREFGQREFWQCRWCLIDAHDNLVISADSLPEFLDLLAYTTL